MNDRSGAQSVEDRQVWAAWVAYTPSWSSTGTQPVIGNGTIYGRYRRIGSLGHLNGVLTAGTTTTFGTGEWRLSLPSGWAARTLTEGYQIGHILMTCAGNTYSGNCWSSSASTVLRMVTNAAIPASVTATVPGTWLANSSNWLSFNITLELAT